MEEALTPPSEAPGFAVADQPAIRDHEESIELMPPSDAGHEDPAAQQRAEVDAMVNRCLDGAMGLACRSLDPDGLDPEGADVARQLVMRSLADNARKRISDDDESVRAVMRRTAELTMDALVAHGGSAVPGVGVELSDILPTGVPPSSVAPGGRVRYAVLQDTLAAARATDREVAYTTLAASIPLSDTSTLLGIAEDDVHSALLRIGRRLGEAQAPATADAGAPR